MTHDTISFKYCPISRQVIISLRTTMKLCNLYIHNDPKWFDVIWECRNDILMNFDENQKEWFMNEMDCRGLSINEFTELLYKYFQHGDNDTICSHSQEDH